MILKISVVQKYSRWKLAKVQQRTHHQICAIHDRERRFRCAVIKRKANASSNKRPGSLKISNFARIPFQITSCAYQGTRQNLIVLDKNYFCVWACWIFLIEFCLFFVSLKFKHSPIISKQTLCALQATRPYSHSDSHDGWHVKYEVFPCLAEEFFEFCSSSWFVHVVQGNMSMLSNKSKASKTFVAFRLRMWLRLNNLARIRRGYQHYTRRIVLSCSGLSYTVGVGNSHHLVAGPGLNCPKGHQLLGAGRRPPAQCPFITRGLLQKAQRVLALRPDSVASAGVQVVYNLWLWSKGKTQNGATHRYRAFSILLDISVPYRENNVVEEHYVTIRSRFSRCCPLEIAHEEFPLPIVLCAGRNQKVWSISHSALNVNHLRLLLLWGLTDFRVSVFASQNWSTWAQIQITLSAGNSAFMSVHHYKVLSHHMPLFLCCSNIFRVPYFRFPLSRFLPYSLIFAC